MGYEDDIMQQLSECSLTDEEKELIFNAFIAVGKLLFDFFA